MNLTIKYEIMPGGVYNGLPCITIAPGKKEISEIEALELIRTSAKTYNLKVQLLVVYCDHELTTDEHKFIGNILYSLPEWIKVGVLGQGILTPFIPYLNHIIAVISNSDWHKYQANEIWLTVPEEADVGPNNAKSQRFLYNVPIKDAYKFMLNANLLWGIIPPTKRIEVQLH